MSAEQDFSGASPFEVRLPVRQTAPFVFNSPHSGRAYPARFLAMARLDREAIRRSEDCHVDDLFAHAVALGAPLLAARFPRAYLKYVLGAEAPATRHRAASSETASW